MANGSDFSLPSSSYDIIQKVIHAYILCGDKEVTLDDIASKAGMDRTQVSRNNGFLSSMGIIEGGRKKKITPLGKKLGIAVSHDDKEAAAAAWRELIESSERLTSIVDMVRVQNGISADVLPSKVAANFGLPGGKKETATATKCVIEILKDAELLVEQDNLVKAASPRKAAPTEDKPAVNEDISDSHVPPISPPPQIQRQVHRSGGATPLVPIHINIELHLPATAEQSVYDAIFKSIRANLMEEGDGVSE